MRALTISAALLLLTSFALPSASAGISVWAGSPALGHCVTVDLETGARNGGCDSGNGVPIALLTGEQDTVAVGADVGGQAVCVGVDDELNPFFECDACFLGICPKLLRA